MKKLSVLLTLMMMVSVLFAQEKEAVLIGEFVCKYKNSEAINNNVRNIVIQAFTNKGMHKVIDLNALSSVQKEKFRQSGEGGMNQANSERLSLCTEVGADYIVNGTVTNYDVTTLKSDDGSVSYDAVLTINLIVTNVIDGATKGTSTITARTTIPCDTQDLALTKAVSTSEMKVKKFIGETFKLEVQIVQILEKTEKEASKVLLEVGSGMGVKKNDIFIVNEEQKIGSKVRLIELGKLKVTKVDGEDFSQCKVSDGGEKILSAFNEGKKMKIVYKAKISIKDRLKSM